jgi:preprotein translocase subunit SecF
MSLLQRLYRGETEFDVVSGRLRWFIVSGVLIGISVLSLLILGLERSVDFTGGVVVEATNTAEATIEDVRAGLADIGRDAATVQLLSEDLPGQDIVERIRVETESLDGAEQDELVATVAAVAGITPDETNVDAVGPTFGQEITRRAVQALVIFLLVVVGFISWRFEWKMALAALAALFHDLIITAGIYSLVGFEVTPATVIAILTILGYSLYDTVVVFDKITENVRELHNRFTFTQISNLSMNQVLMRSINTSLTSLLPIGSLLFVGSFLLGAATLREFALALFIGVGIGTYSSIFVATPLLAHWKESEPDWQTVARRIARKAADGAAPVLAGAAPEAALDEGRRQPARAKPPRERRKRR